MQHWLIWIMHWAISPTYFRQYNFSGYHVFCSIKHAFEKFGKSQLEPFFFSFIEAVVKWLDRSPLKTDWSKDNIYAVLVLVWSSAQASLISINWIQWMGQTSDQTSRCQRHGSGRVCPVFWTYLEPQEAVPQTLTLLVGVRFIAWHLRRPFF